MHRNLVVISNSVSHLLKAAYGINKKMRDRLPLLLILAFFSSKMTEQNIAGYYPDHRNFGNSTLLQLNQDKSYEIKQQSGIVFFKSKGDWNIDKDAPRLINKDTSL